MYTILIYNLYEWFKLSDCYCFGFAIWDIELSIAALLFGTNFNYYN